MFILIVSLILQKYLLLKYTFLFICRAIENLVQKIEEKKQEVRDDLIYAKCTVLFP